MYITSILVVVFPGSSVPYILFLTQYVIFRYICGQLLCYNWCQHFTYFGKAPYEAIFSGIFVVVKYGLRLCYSLAEECGGCVCSPWIVLADELIGILLSRNFLFCLLLDKYFSWETKWHFTTNRDTLRVTMYEGCQTVDRLFEISSRLMHFCKHSNQLLEQLFHCFLDTVKIAFL